MTSRTRILHDAPEARPGDSVLPGHSTPTFVGLNRARAAVSAENPGLPSGGQDIVGLEVMQVVTRIGMWITPTTMTSMGPVGDSATLTDSAIGGFQAVPACGHTAITIRNSRTKRYIKYYSCPALR
jgi:hypothetical protein